jgi:hypothetical protein
MRGRYDHRRHYRNWTGVVRAGLVDIDLYRVRVDDRLPAARCDSGVEQPPRGPALNRFVNG